MRLNLLGLLLGLAGSALAASPSGPLLIAAGGGSEGEIGEPGSWSARLYRHLLDRGDVTGDGRITVAVLSAHDETDFIPRYFRWLGAHEAVNVKVDTRAAAASAATLSVVDRADAVFLKGGDQGIYYDLWNDTPLEASLRRLAGRAGAIGGTSAGAMSLAEIALAGGKSLTAMDVLSDACTPMLDDEDGGSGLHTDFFGFLSGATVDTHFTERARLGRMLGVMARAVTDHRRPHVLGIGIAERTGLVIEGGVARVVGQQSVWFVEPAPGAVVWRVPGRPLAFAPLTAHVLVDGWTYDLATRRPGAPPAGANQAPDSATHLPDAGPLKIAGSDAAGERSFDWRLARTGPFALLAGDLPARVRDAIGVTDAHADRERGRLQEGLLRALHDHPGATGFLLARGSVLSRTAALPARLVFGPGEPGTREVGTIAIGAPAGAWRSLSPYVSTHDSGDGSLHAAALTGLTVRVLAATASSGIAFER